MTLHLTGFLLCAALASTAVEVSAQVLINELVPANDSTLRDENGDFSDWFELYNAGDAAVDLEGWGLTDSPKRPFEWVLANPPLPPQGLLSTVAAGKDRQPAAVLPLAPNQIAGLQ